MLPSLRLAAIAPAWVPLTGEWAKITAARLHALLRLNAPSLHTAVAIVPDRGDATRAAIRGWMTAVLSRFAAPDLAVTIRTQKHLTPSFSIPNQLKRRRSPTFLDPNFGRNCSMDRTIKPSNSASRLPAHPGRSRG